MFRRLILATALLIGCGPGTRPAPQSARALDGLPPVHDAPYDLADDQDLGTLRQQFDLIAEGTPERAEKRAPLVAAYADRIDSHLAAGRRDRAYDAMVALLGLWSATELRDSGVGEQLRPHADRLEALRASYARSGGDVESSVTIAALLVAAPERRELLLAELDDIFAYGNSLALAEHDEHAVRARPIEILETAAVVFPTPFVIDRLTELYLARQRALSDLIDAGGEPDFRALVGAHGRGMFRTAWDIVRLYLRTGRADEALAATEEVHGIGEAPQLRSQLADSLADTATASDWMTLAYLFIGEQPSDTDLEAAMAVCVEGARRFPNNSHLPRMAAAIARERAHLPLAIHYTELAAKAEPKSHEIASELAELYQYRVSALALGSRPAAAERELAALEQFHAAAAEQWDEPLDIDLAAAYAAMGRGLLSMGDLDRAEQYFEKSLDRRDNLTALEYLGTVSLKRDEFAQASRYFERALKVKVSDPEQSFARGRILRLLGEAYAGAGRQSKAEEQWERGIRHWRSVMLQSNLASRGRAEVLIETGRILWLLDQRDATLAAFEGAIDVDPGTADTYADIVSFLIVRNRYRDALDAYHRALGSNEIDDYFKVYMSLWVLAEARRTGRPDDPNAVDYLSRRDGSLWRDRLARYAVGEEKFAPLYERANTRGRRAELYYYAAMLSVAERDPDEATRLLEDVLATDMLLFFEYDMAKYILANGLIANPAKMR